MSITEISELVGLIITGIGFIISFVKWIKANNLAKMKSFIEEQMTIAEKQEGLSGAKKLNYVLLSCQEKYGKSFISLEDKIKSYIEECIDFSKKINSK